MEKHLFYYTSHSQFREPTNKPSVSYCEQEDEVHYHPDPFHGHEYVDLGLPSGTLWAKCNVGANSETDYGLYFAWGETQGYANASTKAFSWNDYKFGTNSNLTKYNSTDNKTELDLEDDAAHANMGGDWHMPNKTQCEELFKETKNGFVTNAGAFTQYAWSDSVGHSSPTQTTATISNWDTAGYFFFKNSYASVTEAIAAKDYLFIPAAGYCNYGKVNFVGVWGNVWSSSLITDNVYYTWYFYFFSDKACVYNKYRCYGQSVRGVVTPTRNLITFTIDGTSYQAEKGMTWQQWVDSEYNVVANPYTGAGTINNGKWYADLEYDMVYRSNPSSNLLEINYRGSYALPNDLIDADKSYTTSLVAPPGSEGD